MPVVAFIGFAIPVIICFFIARKIFLDKKEENVSSAWLTSILVFIILLAILWFMVWYLFFTQMEIGG